MLLRVHSASPATPTSRIVRLNLERTRFRYRAGQAVLLGLPGQDQRRPYSIASAPEDARAQGYLEFLIKTDAEGRFGPHLAGLRAMLHHALAPLVSTPATLCFVCGPPGLVAGVPPILGRLGVPPRRIRTEKWKA